MPVADVLGELLAGLEEEGCRGRVVRVNSSIDLGQIGLTAARLAGSGIGIGLQGKGTALIHRRDLSPLANLAVQHRAGRSPWTCTDDGHQPGLARQGRDPVLVRIGTDEAIEAR